MVATNGVSGTNGVNGTKKSALVTADEFVAQSYDYIVCGGGTAGLVVAARLTENPNITVGVIEAGKNRLDDPLVDIPLMFPQMLGNKDYDWNWQSIPQVRRPYDLDLARLTDACV
jgi:choline dehydrogenase-like flavoprotein